MVSIYPAHWETHVVLNDGSPAEIRPIDPGDRERLAAFHNRQSAESIYFRYFRHRSELSQKELDHFTRVDYVDRMAFVVLVGNELVGVGRYERLDDQPTAEVAFFVDDAHHGQGIATLLLEYLAAAARSIGLTGFVASVLPENYSMLAVFRRAGFEVSTRYLDGTIEVEINIEVTGKTSTAIESREHRARVRSVKPFFEPATVLMIGASRREASLGNLLARSLTGADDGVAFAGQLGLVNRAVGSGANPPARIGGHPIVASIGDAAESFRSLAPSREGSVEDPPSIDLAIIAVPATEVAGVVAECSEVGVRAVMVVSSGFADGGPAGLKLQQELVEKARDNGMRLVGPNAFGLVSTDPDVNLRALFYPVATSAGSVAVLSESGPLGAALLRRLSESGAGITNFIGIGNRADVDIRDVIEYWADDEATAAIAVYAEDLSPGTFTQTIRSITPTKPVITVRGGDPVASEAMQQAGCIVVDEVSQLAELAVLADHQPVPKGNRVVIVSNTASVARLTAEACRRNNLEVVVPESAMDTAGPSVLIGDLDTVSFLADSGLDDYEQVIVAAAVSDEVDSVLVALAPTSVLPTEQLRQLLDRVNRAIDKPVVAVALVDRSHLRTRRLPVYTFPEEAAMALGRWACYGRWRSELAERTGETVVEGSDDGRTVEASAASSTIARVIDDTLRPGDQKRALIALSDDPSGRWIDALGLHVPPTVVVSSGDQAVQAASGIGFPVVLKTAGAGQRSAGEAGGAALDLYQPDDVLAAYERMKQRLDRRMERAVVQRMVPVDQLLRADLVHQESAGMVLSVDWGGSNVKQQTPLVRHVLPLDRATAQDLARSVIDQTDVGLPLVEPLAAMIERLASVAASQPQITGISLNPILVSGGELFVADFEVGLERQAHDPLEEVRHL